jgi:Fe-S cluster biogenesis protein NfuA/nitrite reductase/ring-hydroxylating ferredoxin subunit
MTATETEEGVEQLLEQLLDLHGEGLARMLSALDPEVVDQLAEDPVVSSMLLVHGLHPVPLEQRVAAALARVRPYLASHGGDVALLGLEDGVAQLLLKGSCNGCASSAATLELAIERALEEDAPDLLGLEVEGAMDKVRSPGKLLPLVSGPAPSPSPAWVDVELAVEPGELRAAGPGLVVANVAGTLLAYRDACAGCGATLLGGELDDGALACPSCGRRYSLPLAGRLIGPDDLQLDPVPLLEGEGRVRLAVGG